MTLRFSSMSLRVLVCILSREDLRLGVDALRAVAKPDSTFWYVGRYWYCGGIDVALFECNTRKERLRFMRILERIEGQLASTNLPLVAITLAAVPCPDTPVILTLHWHGFIKEKLVDVEEAQTISYTPIPSSRSEERRVGKEGRSRW